MRLTFSFILLFIVSISPPLSAGSIEYDRDIRPLLSDRCFKCHGPDRGVADNDLRLDERQEAIDYFAIVPGKPEESELMARITTDDESIKMPPVDSERKPLTADEVELIRQWIREGAEYTDHWSYSAPQKSSLPDVLNADWSENEIDRFTLARMTEEGLSPAPQADRRTLIRRLYFDLLGLPPSPAEVEEFVNDEDPQAYEKLVDRLLTNPHYGERLAIYWLDLVRYADTTGYHGDNERSIDAYRDYVINAFNNNKPFDQFTIEQLAGDLLENPTIEQKIASGYNRLLQTTSEGGAQAKEYVAIYQADRVRNFSSVWMASTMGCCQCHDHKFDPFSIEDFYSMGAFFADVKEVPISIPAPNLFLPTPEQSAHLDDLEKQLKDLKEECEYDKLFDDWVAAQRDDLERQKSEVKSNRPVGADSLYGDSLSLLPDDSVFSAGDVPDRDVYLVEIPATLDTINGLHLEAIAHKGFKNNSLSRHSGNFVLTGLEVSVKTGDGLQPVRIAYAEADYEQKDFPVTSVLDNSPKTGWAVDGAKKSQNRTAIFAFDKPVTGGDGVSLLVSLRHESDFPQHQMGRFRLSLIKSDQPAIYSTSGLSEFTLDALRKEQSEWSAFHRQVVEGQFRDRSQAFKPFRKEIEKLDFAIAAARKDVRSTLITEHVKPREVRVLPRGNWLDDTGKVVEPAIPASFGEIPHEGNRATRLDLAHWLVQDNPLTSRVFVNRIWKLMFGQGIVRTLEDFGYQGDWPTHPQLLDWLAVDFEENGWDIKQLVKQIVTSETYKQASRGVPASRQKDPFNKLLARQSVLRLNAEMIRDNALTVSGLLADTIGGPSVKPYQPAGYWQHLNFPVREWQADDGSGLYRRGLYTFWCRSFLHPSLMAFDATSREECTADRPRSNTPLQALVLLNDPSYVEAAKMLAAKVVRQGGNDEQQLSWAYNEVLQRQPTAEEQAILLPLLNDARSRFESQPELAEQLLSNGAATVADDVPVVETAAWTEVCRTVLNLHETITRY